MKSFAGDLVVNEMKIDFNVLGVCMKDRISTEVRGTNVITP